LFWHVDLGTAATMYYVMASSDLELNGSMYHVPCVDLGAAATMDYVMASGDLELN
jgi:pantothenate kinase type III